MGGISKGAEGDVALGMPSSKNQAVPNTRVRNGCFLLEMGSLTELFSLTETKA